MTPEPAAAAPIDASTRGPSALHAPLIVALVATRPLLWDGAWGDWPPLIWQALVVLGCVGAVVELWRGAAAPRWSATGVAAALVVALLAPAALRSPLHADGMATWGSWAVHALFAAWLAYAARGRERLVVAALIAGLVGETALAAGQRVWGLPRFAARIAAGDAPTTPGVTLADLAERVARGGVFGTFTQGNALGAYLLLAVPTAAAVAWRRGPWPARLTGAFAALGGAAILAQTDSKGAWVALAIVLAAGLVLRLRGAWRLAPIAGIAALTIVALTVPRARDALAASARVRLDYWRGAAALIAERPIIGHGVRGFAAGDARVMPLAAEPTRYAHCEPLEAAVDGGVLTGAALVALLALVAAPFVLRRRAADAPAEVAAPAIAGDHPLARWAPVGLIVALPYAQLFGVFDLADWPGGGTAVGEMAWATVVGVAMAIACALARLAASPPRAALGVGLAAAALHTCIDFDLHAGGVLGTLAAVACVADRGRTRPLGRAGRIIATALVAVAALGVGFGIARSRSLREAQDLATLAHRAVTTRGEPARDGKASAPDAAAVARQLGEALGFSTERPLDALVAAARDVALADCRSWPRAEPDIELDALSLWPPGDERLPLIEAACAASPWSAHGQALLASDHAALGQWDAAIAAQRAAVDLAPAYVPARVRLAALLRECARRLPSRGAELLAQADAVDAEAARLDRIVDPRDRSR